MQDRVSMILVDRDKKNNLRLLLRVENRWRTVCFGNLGEFQRGRR